jgi:P27 family predicted phage terminase small subunit
VPKTLTLVKPEPVTGQSPPHALGKYGRSLWDRMTREYNVSDGAGIEMLYQACAAAQIAEMLHEEIERDGPMLRVRGVLKAHPAIKDMSAARAFVVRTLTKLGFNYETLRDGPGRPGAGFGWKSE